MARKTITLPDELAHQKLVEFTDEYGGNVGDIARTAILCGLVKLKKAEKAKYKELNKK